MKQSLFPLTDPILISKKVTVMKISFWLAVLAVLTAGFFCLIFLALKPKAPGLPPLFSKGSTPKDNLLPSAKATEKKVPILMYHHIRQSQANDNKIEKGLDVSPNSFEAQMKYLSQKGYQTILLKELFTHQGGRAVVITFDDGYKDVIEQGFDILQKYHFKAVVFIIVDKVGQPGYLTWEDVARLKSAGWEIGSHTLTHPDLTKLNKEKAKKEIQESKTVLENRLHAPVVSFSYPAGRFNQRIVTLVQQAGYQEAVTTRFAPEEKSQERYQLPRVRVSGSDSLASFTKKLSLFK